MKLTPELLRSILRLDASTGKLYWRARPVSMFDDDGAYDAERRHRAWTKQFEGREAFTSVDGKGYLQGGVFRQRVVVHRVVFAIFHGRWPDGDVDHINGIRSDNRPCNLREATRSQNLCNRPSAGGTSEFKGVSWSTKSRKWRAQCYTATGRNKHLGHFDTEEEAARAYDACAAREQGPFARLNFAAAAE